MAPPLRKADEVADDLLRSIVAGELAVGSLLPRESDLAERYGVGRSVVREAMKLLEVHRLVRPTKKRGTAVLDPLRSVTPAVLSAMLFDARGRVDPEMLAEFLEIRAELDEKMTRLAAARRTGISVSLDTNWDPSGDWRDAIEPLLAHVDLLLPNVEEARLLSGESDPEAACRALGGRVGTVVVKLGAEGAIAVRGDRLERLAAPAVPVVDTTGAGDSFDAGFIAATLQGESLREALAMAVACGSLAVGAGGGTGGQPDLETARVAAAALL